MFSQLAPGDFPTTLPLVVFAQLRKYDTTAG